MTFHHIPIPNHAVVTDGGYSAVDGVSHSFQYQVYQMCVPAMTAAALQAFYAAQMPPNGWQATTTYPYMGNLTAQCGDPYCWISGESNASVTKKIALEHTQATSGYVTYDLRDVNYNP